MSVGQSPTRVQPIFYRCLGCDTLIKPPPTICSHQRCVECCQLLPLPCASHPRQVGTSWEQDERGSGVVVAELDCGLLLVQVTRNDGLQYTGVLATNESTLLDITPLHASPLLSADIDAPVQPAAPASLTSAVDATVQPKRSSPDAAAPASLLLVACQDEPLSSATTRNIVALFAFYTPTGLLWLYVVAGVVAGCAW